MRVVVEPCLGGRLGDTYPASQHDVEIRLLDVAPDAASEVLRTESDRILSADPGCRKVVLAVAEGDLDLVRAAEAAGFRFVVDVDLPGEQLSLFVREPAWVTAVDMDLDRVPET